MATIGVCDICKNEGTLTETHHYLAIKRHPALKLDLCDDHMKRIQKEYPKVTPEYVVAVARIKGHTIDLATAKSMLTIK